MDLNKIKFPLGKLFLFFAACSALQGQPPLPTENSHGYLLSPANIRNVSVTDNFWLPIIRRVQEKTIGYAIQKCAEEGRFESFLVAGGLLEGPVRGKFPFDDSDVYKVIEGASNSLISAPNPELEALLDSLIAIVAIGQEEDGYLTTWRTIDPKNPLVSWVRVIEGKRFESEEASHELYNVGHLYEAAYTHFMATGKRNFLDIALKNADYIVKTFGEGEGKLHSVPGHQVIETGLIKLCYATGNEDYLKLSKFFLDNRGNPESHELYGDYSQDHLPVVQQDEAVGHAVRAMYMYAAMTDIAALFNDKAYADAVGKLWRNVVEKKTYITGGVGARHEGEAFGDDYELPNLTAYNETCASIGSIYWNHRLHNLYGNSGYFDVIERTLYNGLISGLSLDGTNFFYPNPLESDGLYKFNQGACTRKNWFDCSCCPTNLIRFIPSIPGLIYSWVKDTVYVNLFVSSDATMDLESSNIRIVQSTDYPWDGKVNISVFAEHKVPITLKIRIPSWARNRVLPGDLYSYAEDSGRRTSIRIGRKIRNAPDDQGYFTITKKWKKGETLEINFPMEVKMVKANPKVEADRGKVALEYGPLVYAVEEIDNPGFDRIEVSKDDHFIVRRDGSLLGGVNVIEGKNLKAIPYYAWSNRGAGKMKVWLDYLFILK